MPRTPAEILAELNALDGDDFDKAVSALINDSGNVVAKARARMVKAGKAEAAKQMPELEQKLADAEEERDRLRADLEAAQAKVPDIAAKEQQWKERLTAKEREWKAKLDEKDSALTKTRRDVHLGKFIRTLVEEHKVDPDYASEVLTSRYADRFRFAEDGTPDVFKPGEESGYDAPSVEQKIALLAADVKKTVKPQFIQTDVDSGGGRGSHGAGGGGKPNPESLVEAKRQSGRYSGIL